MQTRIVMGLMVAAGFVAGGLLTAQTRAADEVRCRVNVEALVADLAKLTQPVDTEEIKRLLQMSDREALERAIKGSQP